MLRSQPNIYALEEKKVEEFLIAYIAGGHIRMYPSFLLRDCRVRRSGFSLSETIIALLILSIALFAVAGVPIMSTKMALHSIRREQAVFLAVHELDELEAEKSNSLTRSRREASDFPGFFLESQKRNGRGEVVVEWSGLAGQRSLTMERPLSRYSSTTRGKEFGV